MGAMGFVGKAIAPMGRSYRASVIGTVCGSESRRGRSPAYGLRRAWTNSGQRTRSVAAGRGYAPKVHRYMRLSAGAAEAASSWAFTPSCLRKGGAEARG